MADGRAHSKKRENYIPIHEIDVDVKPNRAATLHYRWNKAVKGVRIRAEMENCGACEKCLTCHWNSSREDHGIMCFWRKCQNGKAY